MCIQRPTLPLFALCLLFCSQLVGCGNQPASISKRASATQPAQSIQTTNTSSSQSDRWVPPVVLHDPAPGELRASVYVQIGGYGADQGKTRIGINFLSNGKNVQLAGHEQLVCNGMTMPIHQQYAGFQLADAPSTTLEGKTMSCTYRVDNVTTTLSFTVPRAPVIRSPLDGARLQRNAHTVVTYDYDRQAGKLLGVVALGVGAKTLATLDIPGPMQATLDTSTFPSGEGTLSLSQALVLHVTQTGAAFKSLNAEGMANKAVTVTWI